MLSVMITVYGVVALTFMMTMYALEHRGRLFVLGFALGCALSSIYGFLAGAWPFGVVEAIWAAIAVRRFATTPGRRSRARDQAWLPFSSLPRHSGLRARKA